MLKAELSHISLSEKSLVTINVFFTSLILFPIFPLLDPACLHPGQHDGLLHGAPVPQEVFREVSFTE
jgi:hypothetical protein